MLLLLLLLLLLLPTSLLITLLVLLRSMLDTLLVNLDTNVAVKHSLTPLALCLVHTLNIHAMIFKPQVPLILLQPPILELVADTMFQASPVFTSTVAFLYFRHCISFLFFP